MVKITVNNQGTNARNRFQFKKRKCLVPEISTLNSDKAKQKKDKIPMKREI
jgi:hypothetical protein